MSREEFQLPQHPQISRCQHLAHQSNLGGRLLCGRHRRVFFWGRLPGKLPHLYFFNVVVVSCPENPTPNMSHSNRRCRFLKKSQKKHMEKRSNENCWQYLLFSPFFILVGQQKPMQLSWVKLPQSLWQQGTSLTLLGRSSKEIHLILSCVFSFWSWTRKHHHKHPYKVGPCQS